MKKFVGNDEILEPEPRENVADGRAPQPTGSKLHFAIVAAHADGWVGSRLCFRAAGARFANKLCSPLKNRVSRQASYFTQPPMRLIAAPSSR